MNLTLNVVILFIGLAAACGAAPATTLFSTSRDVSDAPANPGSSNVERSLDQRYNNQEEGTTSEERSLDQGRPARRQRLSLEQMRFTGEESSSGLEELGSPSELAWRAWLLVDGESEDQSEGFDSSSLGRRITPKSVFIAPALLPACAEGYHADHMKRCVKNSVIFDSLAHSNFLLDRLNAMHPKPGEQPETAAATGPLQVNIPLGIKSVADSISADETKEENDWVIDTPGEESVEISMIEDFEKPPRRFFDGRDEPKKAQSESRFPMDVESPADMQPVNETDETKVRQEHHTEEEPQESVKISMVDDFHATFVNETKEESEYDAGSKLPEVNVTLDVEVQSNDSKTIDETAEDVTFVDEVGNEKSANITTTTTSSVPPAEDDDSTTKGELELQATTTPLQVNVPPVEIAPTESDAAMKGESDEADSLDEVPEESVEISTIRVFGNASKDSSNDEVEEVAVTIYQVGNASDTEARASTTFFLGNSSTFFQDASISDVVVPVAEFVPVENQTFAEIVDYKVSGSPIEATTSQISDRANSIHSIQDYKRRAAYQEVNARSATNTKSTVPLQQKKSYWWLPPGWRVNPGSEPPGPRNPWNSRDPRPARQRVMQQQNSQPQNPTLLRFWARMPLVRDPSLQQLPTPRERYHRSSLKRSNNLYQDTSAQGINRVVGQKMQRTLGG